MRVIPAAFVFALCAWPPAASAQPAPRDFARWSAQVAAHRPGERDAAVRELETWTKADVDRLRSGVSRLDVPDRTRLVSRALVLHADVALFNRTRTGYTLPGGGADIVLYADGQESGRMVGTFHWDFCRRLIERLPRGERRLHIARVFYRAAGAVLQLWGEYAELEPLLRDGARELGPDAVLLLYEGTMHQIFADPRLQRAFDTQREALARPPGFGPAGRTAPRLVSRGTQVVAEDLFPTIAQARSAAERAFRRALAEDAMLDEARVRLAHVLYDRGRYEDAAHELDRRAVVVAPSGFVAYYGAVVEGLVARARGRLGEAARAFARALEVEPSAQVPRLALSEVAQAQGDRARAMRELMSLERRVGAGTTADPWWIYGRTHGALARDVIDAMARTLP